MNKNCLLLTGLLIATSAAAQSNTNTPAPSAPAPIILPAVSDTPAAAASEPVKEKKKKVAKHKKAAPTPQIIIDEPTVTLTPGAAEVAADKVNVRGQAGLKGEFITHLSKGDAVTVLSQINLDKHQVAEPFQWAKIAFPTNAHVWVNSQFIDATNKTVLASKLNLRGGPGENYSVMGVVERGYPVNPIATKGDWTEIDPPATAYAFIAAMYLKQEASGNLAANPPPSTETAPPAAPEPAPAVVAEAQPGAPAVTNAPAAAPVPIPITDAANDTTPPLTDTNAVAPVASVPPTTNAVAAAPVIVPPVTETNEVPIVATNSGPRIVTHEGVVIHVSSIIEPTDFELFEPSTGTIINYLYTTNTTLDLSRYKGLRIDVTGEERLAERWPNTPVLTVQDLKVVK